MRETGGVNYFWLFLKRYFKEKDIQRHQSFNINFGGECKSKSPDFLISNTRKWVFEFKELCESDCEHSSRSELINWYKNPIPRTRFLPNKASLWISNSIKKGLKQLKAAEILRCPGILVIYTPIIPIQHRLNSGKGSVFTTSMYESHLKFHKSQTAMNKYPFVSAVAHFSYDDSSPNCIGYRIRFYHNVFAINKLLVEPFDNQCCQHYQIDSGKLEWKQLLSHQEKMIYFDYKSY